LSFLARKNNRARSLRKALTRDKALLAILLRIDAGIMENTAAEREIVDASA